MPNHYRVKNPPKSFTQVSRRVAYLASLNDAYRADRTRIRKLMNGGKGAIDVLLKGYKGNDDTLPAANYIKSGIERFSDMISAPPDLKVDPPGRTDKPRDRRNAEKRERIITEYDYNCRLERQLEQVSLWLPGYGFSVWRISSGKDANNMYYPKATLRDPYTTWPSEWGVDAQPTDVAFQRFVDPDALVRIYPHSKPAIEAASGRTGRSGAVDLATWSTSSSLSPGWDGAPSGIEVIEYVDDEYIYVYSPVVGGFLDVIEHPLNRLPLSLARRVTFDDLTGQFDDAVGLASAMAKLTLLAQIAMEDAAFAPIVVSGRMDGPFRKGRDAVNYIEGGDAHYIYQNVPYQMFQEIDRIERHLRSNTGYSKQADGESPISFVTGQGLQELGDSMSRQVQRYQGEIRRALEDLDSKRLEWDDRAYGNTERLIEGLKEGASFSETYVPSKDIAGRYRTRRVYGIMAGLDEARRTVGMLQLLGAKVIDRGTVRENLKDIESASKVSDRILEEEAEGLLFQTLAALAQQGDPNAMAAIIEIRKSPSRLAEILDEFFTVEEEEDPTLGGELQASPEEEFSQVLTRLTSDGAAQGGSQTIRQV
jgi:hypothetical protein